MDPAATDLAYAGAVEQARRIAAGETTARQVVQATLDRIAAVNPALNAFRVVLAEEALAAADAADARIAAGERAPMLGVPVAIKDDTDVAGQVTAWGGSAHGGPEPVDSDVVARLREAGAIPIGKTHVPELTIWPFTESLSFGATRNPWNPDFATGGSSGGSGAAAAAGLCGVAQGSDGGGSVRIPAAYCGLFGLKTQRGRISLGPNHLDAWNGLSVYGPLARRVEDAALFLDATATVAPATSFLTAAGTAPGPLRIAVSVKPPPGPIARPSADELAAVQDVAGTLRELGHTVVDRELDYGIGMLRQFTARYLRGIRADAEGMARPGNLEPRTRGMARMGRLISDGELRRARRDEAELSARINAIFDEVDVVLTPTVAAPIRVGEFHGRGAFFTFNAVAGKVPYTAAFNVTGQPAATVPAGFDAAGVPLSVQLVGRPDDEATLLSLAGQLQGMRRWDDRRPPVG